MKPAATNSVVSARWLVLASLAAAAVGCYRTIDSPRSPDHAVPHAPGGGLSIDPNAPNGILDARQTVANGGVPLADSVSVEGLLRQYDLSDDPPVCDSILCSRPALAIAPSLRTGQREYWVQLGLTSALTQDSFRRPALDVAVAIDRSSSMAVDLAQVYDALNQLMLRLRSDDRLAIIMYNGGAETLRGLATIDDRADIIRRVRMVQAAGPANMSAGVRAAIDVLRNARDAQNRLRRLMVFACENPQGAGFGENEFGRAIRVAAVDRIGTSFFGVLTGASAPASQLLTETRGGAYYSLNQLDTIQNAFDHEFETMVTPIAYDVDFGLTPAADFDAAEVYGVSGTLGASHVTQFHVATAFVNARRGAVIVRLRARAGVTSPRNVGSVALSYVPETAIRNEGNRYDNDTLTFPTEVPDGASYFSSHGVRRGVTLLNEAEQLRDALTAWHAGDHARGADIVAQLVEYVGEVAQSLDDAGLRTEQAFLRRLHENMTQ